MVERTKHNVSELQLEKFPTPSTFLYEKTNFKTEVCSASDHPAEAMPWIKEVEMSNTVDDLETSQPISGRQSPNFETLLATIATALKKSIQNSNFKIKAYLKFL